MWFYSFIFLFITAILSAGYFFKVQKESYWCCIMLLIVIAGFRPEGIDNDYVIYTDYYENAAGIPFTFLEPTYFLISGFSRILFNSPIGVFIIYSILGTTLKGLAFIRLTKYYAISLILYFGSFFLLHEMTQIRVGVASAILLLSVPSIVHKNYREFLIWLIAGTLFHYSFIIFGFCYFLNSKRINPPLYLGMIILTFIAAIAGFNLTSFFQLIRLGFISDKIDTYKSLLDQGIFGDLMLINPLLFLRFMVLALLLLNWKTLKEKSDYAVILIKIYAFSIFFFIAFADLPVLAGRISQLFGIAEVIVVPFIIYIVTPKYCAVALVLLFAMLIMYKQLFYSNLLTGYFN